MTLPAGFVDPTDSAQVGPVLAGVLDRLGLPGLVDLLSRLPGVVLQPGRPGGLLRRAKPPCLLTESHRLVLGDPVRDEHVVGGVVLSHRNVPPRDVVRLVTGCVVAAVAAGRDAGEAAVALTSLRDALGQA